MFHVLHHYISIVFSQLLPLYCLLQRQVNQDVEVSAYMRQSLVENMCNVEITMQSLPFLILFGLRQRD